MQIVASRSLRFVYVLAVLAAVLPLGLANSAWVGLTTGSVGMAIPFMGSFLFLGLGIFRVVSVFKNPQSLNAYHVSGFAAFLRNAGILALYIGAIVAVLNLLSFPLIKVFMPHRSESGVEFYVVGVFFAFLGGFAPLGIVAFELSRILGFEEDARDKKRLAP